MEYYSLNRYLREKFGVKVYKISLDAGFTCPNRDGTKGDRGCIFCSGKGSGDFAAHRFLSITGQIEAGKKLVEKKAKGALYIAYFQAFTNTYAPAEKLERLYMEAAAHPEVAVISIATRPDCLGEEVLEVLRRLNEVKPVWVELGLQTIHARSAAYIRRGYDLPVYDEAVRNLKRIGIAHIVTHIILGLPGESREEMLETVDYVGKSGVDGVKLQLLHVLRGTDLEKDYTDGKFKTLSMDEYIELVVQSIKVLPENMVIHRMTGDGDKNLLVAPKFSADKKRVLNALKKAIENA